MFIFGACINRSIPIALLRYYQSPLPPVQVTVVSDIVKSMPDRLEEVLQRGGLETLPTSVHISIQVWIPTLGQERKGIIVYRAPDFLYVQYV
jgi:hypothetical protein